MASCSNDDALQTSVDNNNGLVPVTLSATIDPGVQTRATGDDATRCLLQIIESDGTTTTKREVQTMTLGADGSYTATAMLNPNNTYTFLFWADGGESCYTATDLEAVTIAGEDGAGIAWHGKATWSSSESTTIEAELKHAVTKVTLQSTTAVLESMKVTISGVKEYSTFNVLDGKVTGETITSFTHSGTGSGNTGDVFSFYALVSDETQNLTLNTGAEEVNIPNVPLARNKHVILSGDVANAGLTEFTFTATLDTDWGGMETVIITPSDGPQTLNLTDGDVVNITGDAIISTTGNYYTFNISEGNTATVNLNRVELNWSGTQNYDCYAFSIDGGGTIIFNLCSEENTIQGFYNGIRGIWDGTAGNIHIIGPGTLNIKGTNVYGGIVTDKTKEIRIENAAVNMDYQYSSGDYPGAAIGSGSGEECGDITISNSAISIDIATTLQDGTLTADNWFGAAIGAGRNGACGNINITLQEGQTQAQFLEGISVQHTTLNVALDDEQKVGKGVYSQSCGTVTWLNADGSAATE